MGCCWRAGAIVVNRWVLVGWNSRSGVGLAGVNEAHEAGAPDMAFECRCPPIGYVLDGPFQYQGFFLRLGVG